MRLIDADNLKEDINSRFLTKGEKRLLCRIIDKAPTIARTERPFVIDDVTCKGCIHNMGYLPGTDDIYCEYIEDHNNNYRCEYYEEDNNNG